MTKFKVLIADFEGVHFHLLDSKQEDEITIKKYGHDYQLNLSMLFLTAVIMNCG